MSTTAQLEEVQAAITALLAGGQEVQLGEQRLKMADLEALQARESMLLARLARENRSSRPSITIGTQRR